ncbi:UDP-4-amino-4-deoxy-L-arabinose--oxoglutarate aminotransferase [Anaerohalosphaera lusitana]|uniref:UDP-4-amino-4-deoxy-L-arabinose--oxoglutarate aminotransferase n=1 Tax=Anaerohalosphaera lusitana TaxID=1936003 RepID=A0A1U9NKZ0_9BACT|nr:DegT/DnrJ/EryC1/StrS family aminotransferase [Anaerohalosphaera lusitana]AQT68601.1 UDP-4-amino-4-deoxy-L-arabinose--oxoglutarate aminotransferase [Anaerohalosphaera lusitana]
MRVHLSRPDITQAEIDAVTEVLKSPNLSLGPKLGEFEQAFCDYIGRKHAVAVNSGTSGLFLCMQSLGIGPGDEVITTPFTFIASVTSIMMTGAKPVFVDIDPVSLNMDSSRIEAAINEKTKAILPVVVFGNPAGLDEVSEIADRHNLAVIEDSCEALGSELNGRKVGTFGTMSLFAFYPNKQITTGEGGMILTDDDELANMCVSLRNQGRGRGGGWLAHERLGYNYRLSDINCALGIVQLSRIGEFVEKRKQVAAMYQELLADEKRLIVPKAPAGCEMSWFVFVVRIADENITIEQRNAVLQAMLDRGVQVSNYFPPVYLQPFIAQEYGLKEGDFPITDAVCKSTIALPFHNNLTQEEVETVCKELKASLDDVLR